MALTHQILFHGEDTTNGPLLRHFKKNVHQNPHSLSIGSIGKVSCH